MTTAVRLRLLFIILLARYICVPMCLQAQPRQDTLSIPDDLIPTCKQILLEKSIRSANSVISSLRPFADTAGTEPSNYPTQEKIYLLLSEAYVLKADYKHAYEYLKLYWRIHDSLLNQEKEIHINSLKQDYYIQKGNKDIINGRILTMTQNRILEKKKFLISLILISFASATILSILYYQNHKRKLSLMRRTLQQADQEHSFRILKTKAEAEEKEREHISHYLRHTLYEDIEKIRHEFIHQKTKYANLATKAHFEELIHVLSSAKDILYQSVHNLNTEEFNLEQELHKFVNHVNRELFIDITVSHAGPLTERHKNNELLIFRIVRELIQNVIKHAHATKAGINVRFDHEKVTVLVEDNGRGIDPEKLEEGMGLSNILRIAAHYHGSVNIHTEAGTQVVLTLPNHVETPDSPRQVTITPAGNA